MKIAVAIYSPFQAWCIPAAQVDWLRREFPAHAFVRTDDDEATLREIPDADAAFGARLRPEHVAAARRLRWVHSPAAGVGNMLFPAMVASPIVLTNSRGIASVPIAEHVIAVTLALLRGLPLAWRRQGERIWAQNEFHEQGRLRTLRESRLLIVGLGSIGSAVAALASAFGAQVVGIRRRHAEAKPDGVTAVHPPEALHQQLPLADVVVVAAPQTADTHSLFGARELALLPDGAILVNVARGKLIDEAALASELARGRIRAALDVFEHEPLDAASPLWESAALITPHVSGHFAGYWPAAAAMFADNLRRFEAGMPLLNAVDKRAGY